MREERITVKGKEETKRKDKGEWKRNKGETRRRRIRGRA